MFFIAVEKMGLFLVYNFHFPGKSENSNGITGRRKFCCWQLLRDLSDHQLVLPKQTLLMGQGTMVHGCYYPLSKKQLEWQISISDITKQAEKELTSSMQVTLSLNAQLSCK